MNKKILIILICMILCVFLYGCNNTNNANGKKYEELLREYMQSGYDSEYGYHVPYFSPEYAAKFDSYDDLIKFIKEKDFCNYERGYYYSDYLDNSENYNLDNINLVISANMSIQQKNEKLLYILCDYSPKNEGGNLLYIQLQFKIDFREEDLDKTDFNNQNYYKMEFYAPIPNPIDIRSIYPVERESTMARSEYEFMGKEVALAGNYLFLIDFVYKNSSINKTFEEEMVSEILSSIKFVGN